MTEDITYRRGTPADSYTVFEIFELTLTDLVQRLGSTEKTSSANPRALERMWAERRSLYEHLAHTAERFWIAERQGQAIAFARSILRDEVRQLTELFVLPGEQSSGLGRELIQRAFPLSGARLRSVIATADTRAQTLYLKMGLFPRFPIYYFGRKPEAIAVDTDLSFKPITSSPDHLDLIGRLDRRIIAHHRDEDHKWLIANRQGYLYYRDGQLVGYGYLGKRNGPFSLLEAADFPAILAHGESQAAENGHQEFGVEVPMINEVAVGYLLQRRFRIDSFVAMMMSNTPFGQFENYIITSPPFLL